MVGVARGTGRRTLFCPTATYQRQAGFVATPALAAAVLASLRRRAHSRQTLAPLRPLNACALCACDLREKGVEDLGGDGNLESRWLGQAKGGLVVDKGRDLGMQGGRRCARGTVAVLAWFSGQDGGHLIGAKCSASNRRGVCRVLLYFAARRQAPQKTQKRKRDTSLYFYYRCCLFIVCCF